MPGLAAELGQLIVVLFVVLELGQDLVAHVAVGPDVLNVVTVLQCLDDPEHLAGSIKVKLNFDRGDEGSLSRVIVACQLPVELCAQPRSHPAR